MLIRNHNDVQPRLGNGINGVFIDEFQVNIIRLEALKARFEGRHHYITVDDFNRELVSILEDLSRLKVKNDDLFER